MYGSSRLGINTNKVDMLDEDPEEVISLTLGNKLYEMSNHLGNVLTVISDIKIPQSSNSVDVDGYLATIVSTADYSPFGSLSDHWRMQLDGRTESAESYRYGYQGSEKDDEVKGSGNSYITEFRMLDPRLGRWLSIDPLAAQFPWQSPYVSMDNNPIALNDYLGKSSETTIVGKNGKVIDIINDGKTDIIQFNVDEDAWKGCGSELLNGGGGTKVGQTIFWYDFMKASGKDNNAFSKPAYGAQVMNESLNILGDNFNGTQIAQASTKMYIDMIKYYDATYSLAILAYNSADNQIFDIKKSLGFDSYTGVYLTTIDGDKIYTSLRVLGNMIFGANLDLAYQKSMFMSKESFYKMAMVFVGGYNMRGKSNGQYDYPYFGEHILSGSAIYLGYWGYKYQPKKSSNKGTRKMGFWEEVIYKTKNGLSNFQNWHR